MISNGRDAHPTSPQNYKSNKVPYLDDTSAKKYIVSVSLTI